MSRLGLVALGLIALVAFTASPAAAKKGKTKTITAGLNTCLSTALAIPDHLTTANAPGVQASIPLNIPNFRGKPQAGVVTSVSSVAVRIPHTFAGDLTILLVSPSGQVITLANKRGGTADGYGTGTTSCGGSLVVFSDTASSPIFGANPGNTDTPLGGSFRPEAPLASLVGSAAKGNWVLFVSDGQGVDVGVLDAFGLSLTYQYKKGPKK